jgi:hypothetical protein
MGCRFVMIALGFASPPGSAVGWPACVGRDAIGMPCPICNPADELTPLRLPAGFVETAELGAQ